MWASQDYDESKMVIGQEPFGHGSICPGMESFTDWTAESFMLVSDAHQSNISKACPGCGKPDGQAILHAERTPLPPLPPRQTS